MGKTTDVSRLFTGAIMIGLLFVTMNWLQSRFDTSDHDKAVTIVKAYRAQTGRKLVDALLEAHDGVDRAEISWSSEITSGCFGHVRVHAFIPAKSAPAATYSFDVNLSGPSLHPTDEVTVGVMRQLNVVATTTTSTSAS